MLASVGLISKDEFEIIETALGELLLDVKAPDFILPNDVEDIHSYVEIELTRRIGEAGKKIHTGRSRNDQVAVDIKLFLRDAILGISTSTFQLFQLLIQKAAENSGKLLPGYPHLQVAMPSSAGLWLSAYAESLVDDLILLHAAFEVVNKNPLGSGAGYGSSFPLDRKLTTQQLNFATLNWNSIYAQMTRGKAEKLTTIGIAAIASSLSKLAYDCCLYLNQNFAFISFPDNLTTGSSIMPHKKNPDVWELIRAKFNRLQARPNEITLLVNNLPSGYHRDMQLTKEIVFPAIKEIKDCIAMACLMLGEITVKDNLLDDERYRYIFTVEAMNELVGNGISYRDAYRQVGEQVQSGTFHYQPKNMHHTHEGSIGNLCLDEISNECKKVMDRFY